MKGASWYSRKTRGNIFTVEASVTSEARRTSVNCFLHLNERKWDCCVL